MRGSGEAASRANRAISHARGHLRVSRFARRTTEKREAARSLLSRVPSSRDGLRDDPEWKLANTLKLSSFRLQAADPEGNDNNLCSVACIL